MIVKFILALVIKVIAISYSYKDSFKLIYSFVIIVAAVVIDYQLHN